VDGLCHSAVWSAGVLRDRGICLGVLLPGMPHDPPGEDLMRTMCRLIISWAALSLIGDGTFLKLYQMEVNNARD